MALFHVLADGEDRIAQPVVRHVSIGDVLDALRCGWKDFLEKPSVYLFAAILYPIVGIFLALWTSGTNTLPMLFPLASGFALIGPFAAIGLYEMSRRKEQGLDTSWRHAMDVVHSPAIPSILAAAFLLFAIFYIWLGTAEALYQTLFGLAAPTALWPFLERVFTTPEGWALIVYGNLIGLCFALVTLFTTVVAFPLLLDRDVGVVSAVTTSIRVVLANPLPMLVWGLIVAALLVVGTIPFFAGLIVVMPVLGHATWHLYRRTVA